MRLRATTLVSLAALAGCGVPAGNETFSEIPPDEVLFELDATSTTSTSTTSTTSPALPETTALATTTTIRLEPVQIYFLSRGRLQPITVDLPPGSSPDQVADVLEAGPPRDVALESLIEDGLIVSAVESGGVLTVDLDPTIFDQVPSTQQTEAIGQIVLTMLSSLRGIGQVTFTLGGEAVAVKKGNGQLSDVGEPLSYDAFANLLAAPRASADTTTTTTTIESVPTSVDQ
ncbi:MAG TPA: GerMN domain-containing protein [Ilumatobacteraceae bacterium]|nr:GerMN domain-containing protein [Ilumatobacteraceae bacterium]